MRFGFSLFFSPAPEGVIIQCTIRRDRSNWKKKLWPQYNLNLSNQGYRFLMSARKRSGQKTSHYLISKDMNDQNRKSQHYLGKVRSNFMGTRFNIWNEGLNPKKAKKNPEG